MRLKALLFAILLTSCSDAPHDSTATFSGTAMTMHYRIVIGSPLNKSEIQKINAIAEATFREVNTHYNIWNPDSELSQVNRARAGTWIPLSSKLYKLLLITDHLNQVTLGFFDPTIMPAYNLWKKKLADNQLPNKKELTSLMASIGWDKIQLKESAIWKESEEVQIDLGGIAKGYCVDLLTERLIDAGYNNCYVEWGGEIRTHGQHPEKRPWKVYISNLTDSNPDHALDVISLNNEALATSGDYLQQWTYSESEENKLTFTHIVHPKTLLPIKVHSKNICSATVKAKTCTMADAFATASMLFASKNDANQWIASLKDSDPLLEFWLMTREEINDLTPTPLE